MSKGPAIQIREAEADRYATHDDFHTIFNEDVLVALTTVLSAHA